MLTKPSIVAICALLFLGGCAQLDDWTDTTPQPDAAPAAEDASAQASTLYVIPEQPAGVAAFRTIYIAPANLANMQVIQPEGAPADAEWWVTDEEGAVLQRAIAYEFSVALTEQSDFIIVTSPQQAQLVVNTAVVAVHPNETRASIAKGAKPSGSITVSVAVVSAASGVVLMRSVDTRSSDDIWAFNEVKDEDPAINRVFRTWGMDIRSGLFQLQGRSGAPMVLNAPK